MPNAIISVFDKTNIDYLGKILIEQNYTLYATAGTRKVLEENNITVHPVEEITDNPAGFENYVSSLSFSTVIGTLARDESQFSEIPIKKIDLVVYNFVPTWSEIKTLDDFNILHVDLGGPTIIKAAAINFKHTLPIVSPEQYKLLIDIDKIDLKLRVSLAESALSYCSWYENQLSKYLKALGE